MEAATTVPSDRSEPETITAAAHAGEAWAQNWVGVQYLFGEGVPKDPVSAAEWIRKAAEQGDRSAQANLGQLYFEGTGVPEDDAQAARWLLMAAEQGQSVAQRLCGYIIAITGDFVRAAHWYRRAAEQGDALAQNNLGNLFWEGKGVPKNFVEAYKWLNLAAAQSVDTAVEGLEIAAKRMARDQIAEAQRLTAEFAPREEPDKKMLEQTSKPTKQESDLTHLLERLEVFEERLGVRLEAVLVQAGNATDGTQHVWVSGELHPREGLQLKQDIWIEIAVYDSKGRVANVANRLILAEKFFGFEAFMLNVPLLAEPFSKIRLHPKPY